MLSVEDSAGDAGGDEVERGEYNLATGIINREVKAKVKAAGPTKTLIKQLVPLVEPLHPLYREKVAKKDAEVAGE